MALPLLSAVLILLPIASAQWQPMFDGKTLQGWRETPFRGHPPVRVEKETIVLAPGAPMTGITWAGDFPTTNYEFRFEAVRLQGNDFFASLTFPVGESFCTWVMGGWGGDIVGLSSIDGWDASDNETRTYFNFDNGKWYALRLQVTPEQITAWIDDQSVIKTAIAGRTISLRPGDIRLNTPLGFASYNTGGAIRKIEYRKLGPGSK